MYGGSVPAGFEASITRCGSSSTSTRPCTTHGCHTVVSIINESNISRETRTPWLNNSHFMSNRRKEDVTCHHLTPHKNIRDDANLHQGTFISEYPMIQEELMSLVAKEDTEKQIKNEHGDKNGEHGIVSKLRNVP